MIEKTRLDVNKKTEADNNKPDKIITVKTLLKSNSLLKADSKEFVG